MLQKGIVVQIIGLVIMGIGIGLQLSSSSVSNLFVTFLGLFVVFAGLFIIISKKKKEK